MENKKKNQTFSYTYSAREQEEIKNIRKKYAPAEEDKMALLRRLDRNVYDKATMNSIIIGVIGTLVLGIGMSCVLVWQTTIMYIAGVSIGIVGIALVAAAYPVYNRTLKKEREKIAPEILRLTDELMK